MMRSTELPFLPGYSFNYNAGQTRFHKSQHFELMGKGVPYLSEKSLPGIGGIPLPNSEINRFPSVYARGEVSELPTWVVYNKETLAFDAYYLENVYEGGLYKNYVVHKCKICYFLEDGTVQVFEKPITNSGLPQGCIIKRQKIRIPGRGNSADFYDMIDFNIGREIELFGKVFKITNCDVFTRRFLNRLGIPVPDPLDTPEDPYLQHRSKEGQKQRRQVLKSAAIKNLLEMDNRILTFDAYWDDTKNEGGSLHLLKIYYYLIDGTIEIRDITDRDRSHTLVKRGKFSKEMEMKIAPPGAGEQVTLLNVIGTSVENSRSVVDPLGIGIEDKEYYTDKDLTIGSVLGSYSRKFVITDMDKFTKEYYKLRYGLDDLHPLQRPKTKDELSLEKAEGIRPPTPPYNGFGSYDDTMINVRHLDPSAKVKTWKRDTTKEPLGYDSKILRFGAVLLVNGEPVEERRFIVCYYILDNTISVFEVPIPNSGREGGNIIKRRKIYVPGQNLFTNKPPQMVGVEEFYLGSIVNLDNFIFHLVNIDEYTMKYMELHPNEFPKSNIRYIINKVRESVRSKYKQWAAPFLQDNGIAPYNEYRDSLKSILGNAITEHEILTLARHFIQRPPMEMWTKEQIRGLIHDELRRFLYDDFKRLRESFCHFDPKKSGYVSVNDAYSTLRGARIPCPGEFLRVVVEMFSEEGKDGECIGVKYDKVLDFINYRKHQVSSVNRIDFRGAFGLPNLLTSTNDTKVLFVDMRRVINELKLEDDLKKESK